MLQVNVFITVLKGPIFAGAFTGTMDEELESKN